MTQYGLIGYPLGHSWSAKMFNARFADEHIDARYDLYPISSISDFKSLVEETPSLVGLNVTIPYKQQVIPYLDSLSAEASEAGAVNTIRIQRDENGCVKRLEGFNTDITGFMRAVSPLLPDLPDEGKRRALVLGSGGASRAVVVGLRKLGWRPDVVSRHPADNEMGYDQLTPEVIESHPLVVNTTPLGMYPKTNAAPPFPFQYLSPHNVCFDLVYNPEETLFMRIAAAHGCRMTGGLSMLEYQAEDAWKIWTQGASVHDSQ